MLSCFPDAPLAGLSPKVKSVVRSRFGKLGYLFYGPALRRTISDERPDIVHAHFASGYGFLCSTWLKREAYILSIWGADIFEFPTGPVRRRVFVRNLAHAGQLLSTSVCMVMEARKYTDRSVHLTPFGADLSMFRPFRPRRRNGDTFRIGTARVLDYKYGVDTLIKAFAIFRNACWGHDVQLLIAGDGPDRDMLERLAADLGVADGVTFVGWLHHDQLPSFFNGLDVFCALSRLDSESFGVAVLEASACGVPVIGSNIGGLPETIQHGKTGLLVSKELPREAAECLTTLFEDNELRHRLGQAGRAFVAERYDWDCSLDIMERIYADFLAR